MVIDEKDHGRLRAELARIAEENGMYLAFSYGYYSEPKGENKHVLIDDSGSILIDYAKRYLLGMGDVGETKVFRKGPEILQFADTPYGRITLTVCREMEMEKYMIQAGGADIMFSSAYEWPETWLPNNLQMPAVNGFSLVRTAYNGVTHSQDYNGRLLDQMHFEDTSGIMYTEVPVKGVKTLYSYVGKSIGWLSALGLLVLLVLAVMRRKK
jgi:apolipoprotein N-acyltransferase